MAISPMSHHSAIADQETEPAHEGGGHRAAALGLFVATYTVAAAALMLVFINRPEWHVGQWYFLVDLSDAFVFGLVGWVLLSRTSHTVAWIIAGCALGGAVAALGMQWTELRFRHPDVPELPFLQSTQNWAWVPGTLGLILVVPYLVRDEPLRPLDRVLVGTGATMCIGFVLFRWTDPFPWPDGESIMPLAIQNSTWLDLIEPINQWLIFACVILGGIATADVVRRWRVLAPDRRRGLGWLAIGVGLMTAAFIPLAVPPTWFDFLPPETTPILHLLSQLFFPAALLVAVLGQQLWGLRLAVSRTIAWSLLTALLIAGYAGLIAISGLLIPGVTDGVEQVAVTAILAAAIEPVRRFVQRRVDHLVHGDSNEPIRVVGRVGQSIGAGGTPAELLGGVLDDLVTSLRLRGAAIDVVGTTSTQRQAVTGDISGADELLVPLVLDDELVGSLHLWPRPGERIDGQTERTIAALTPLVAVAARLAATAVALTESRSQLATARVEERRALRRELHDGLGPALAGVGYGLQATRNLLDVDPTRAGPLLDRMIEELDARVEDVRSLARDLVPPTLLDAGLPAALAELAERQRLTGLSVELDVTDLPPLSTDVATTLYGIIVEAVRNVVRHASATACRISAIHTTDGRLRLSVSDDGVGIDPDAPSGVGTQSMRERAEAIGGRLSIESAPIGGTTVAIVLDALAVRS
jgi:signal transduction histidine kinase